MKKIVAGLMFLAALFAPLATLAQGPSQPGIPLPVVNGQCIIGSGGQAIWGSCSGSGAAVTSVSGTAGQVTVSPTTGATVVSLPGTITQAENFTGGIGAGTAGSGAFTTLSASSTVSGTGFSTYLASPPAIGGTAAAAGSFTTLSASSTVSGTGFSTYLASPPGIGGTTAAAGAFTTLSASSTVSGTGFSTYLASPPAIGGTAAAAGSFTTLSASSTVSGTGFSTYLASPPAIGGTVAAAANFTTLGATGQVTFSGLATATQTSCVGINGSNVLVLSSGACGTGGGGSLTVSDTLSHSVTSTTTISLSAGLALSGNGTGTATVLPYAPDRTVASGTVTFSTADLGGQVAIGSANATNTATIPGGSVFTVAGQTLLFASQNATVTTITNTFTAHGLGLSTKLHQFGWYAYTYNGTDLDAFGWPGVDTVTNNTVPIFVDASGALTASEITDAAAGGVTIGSPTGGQKGAGTINATGLFVNGAAVSSGGSVTSIATTSPITGGTITTTGTIACATCVTSAAALTSGKVMTGASSQGSQVDANAALSAGALTLGASGTAGSVAMGNATSGTVTLQTVSGSLGSVTASLPANTGTLAELNLEQSWTAPQAETPVNVAISTATFTPNFNTTQNMEIDLTSACPCTLANPSGTLVAGTSGMIEIHQDGTGSRTIGTWGSDYQYAGGTSTITLSTAASAVDYLPYYVNNAATGIVFGTLLKAPAH